MNSSDITHPKVAKESLVAFAKNIPGAWVGLRIASILLILEGQRPGRPSRLTPKIAQKVEKHLEQSPQVFGLTG